MNGRTSCMPDINGARVLSLVASGDDTPRREPAARSATLTRVVAVGTATTARQIAAGLAGIPGYVLAGCVLPASGLEHVGKGASGVQVLGEIADLPILVARFGIKMAVVCLPASQSDEFDRVQRTLAGTGVTIRRAAALEDVLRSTAGPEALSEPASLEPASERTHRFTGAAPSIDLAKLIGRTPYEMDRAAIGAILRNKCVLISGAGGSIGSELAKVAAAFEPSLLVLMERSENALFEIDRQIGRHFPGVKRKPVLHDVVDAEATLRLCELLRPHVVFHAAAHKHVPLMEDHPAHAVTNNLFGTKSIADAAVAVGAERFVMISSDKAVNPTSVMGATKRLAEMYVRGLGEKAQGAGQSTSTRLSMVRFGNVLGSNASVLTIWAQQIAEGGPLTITDPRMTRFFMTIPEAATLVVQSATLAPATDRTETSGSSDVGVFVLDMGEPVRIVELAERFIRAHGMAPATPGATPPPVGGPTMALTFTGIRPGEKLHEELAYAAEQLRPTAHPGIRAWAGPGFGKDVAARMREMVNDLNAARFNSDPARVVEAIRKHVPEMRAGPAGAASSPEQAANPQAG